MKKILIFNVLFALLFSYVSFAQDENAETEEQEQWEPMVPKTDIFDKKIVVEKKPIEYAEIKEEDVLWSQFVWRVVDCREKMNFHIYYPTEDILNRKSLAQALIDGVRNGKVQAYGDENFTTKVALEKVLERLGGADKKVREESMDTPGEWIEQIQKGFVNWRLVREYKIKEKWFFDKKHSKLDVRILAICPVKVFKKSNTGTDIEAGGNDTDVLREELFWVYFPEARRVLANTTCYTGKNQQANISYDDVFFKRFFSSRIVQAANVNDLMISDYTHGGLEAILESERIKNEMLKLESDFWSY
ncbi:MAG: gliding motility protein GldN [Prevotellaceae bacterium]|jgi:gliding motility associated protien GldN|nr:gliding motility protein GldN [Prevotellaceae bacterium]